MKHKTRQKFALKIFELLKPYGFQDYEVGREVVFTLNKNNFRYQLYFDTLDPYKRGHVMAFAVNHESTDLGAIIKNAGSEDDLSYLEYFATCNFPDVLHEENRDGYEHSINNMSDFYIHEDAIDDAVECFKIKYLPILLDFIDKTSTIEKLDELINKPILITMDVKVSIYFAVRGGAQVFLGLIVAKLLKRDYYDTLVRLYEGFLKKYFEGENLLNTDTGKNFYKLIKYLDKM